MPLVSLDDDLDRDPPLQAARRRLRAARDDREARARLDRPRLRRGPRHPPRALGRRRLGGPPRRGHVRRRRRLVRHQGPRAPDAPLRRASADPPALRRPLELVPGRPRGDRICRSDAAFVPRAACSTAPRAPGERDRLLARLRRRPLPRRRPRWRSPRRPLRPCRAPRAPGSAGPPAGVPLGSASVPGLGAAGAGVADGRDRPQPAARSTGASTAPSATTPLIPFESTLRPMLDTVTIDDFRPLQGDRFRIAPDGAEPLEVELVEVTEIPREPGGRAPFSLVFRGGPNPPLLQSIYRVEHEKFGELDIFLVPIAVDRYQAIFT